MHQLKKKKKQNKQIIKIINKIKKKKIKTKQSNNNYTKQTKKTPNKTIRVNIEKLNILMNLFEELVIDRGRLEQISSELNNSELQDTVERMSRVSSDLQNII